MKIKKIQKDSKMFMLECKQCFETFFVKSCQIVLELLGFFKK